MRNGKMKVTRRSIIFGFLFVFSTAFAGIYRHDRDLKLYTSLASEKQFDCVGHIYNGKHSGASCILIGERTVLSAAHCFHDKHLRPDTVYFEFNGVKYAAKKITWHEQYSALNSNDYDIAFIELQQRVINAVPAKLCTTYNELHSDVTGVGYGYINKADKPDKEDEEPVWGKMAGENVIDSIGGPLVDGKASVLVADFDAPKGCKYYGQCNKMGSSLPKELEYDTNGGDSGGGLFRKGKEGWELVGIVSGGGIDGEQFLKTWYYGQVSVWTRVSAFQKWINKSLGQIK